MIVLTLTDCPPSLRGDLSKWLIEINAGVYVGRVSARVRDAIWERVKEFAKTGKATLVYPAKNEQRMIFRVHNATWEPIDFDGLSLMLHPSNRRLSEKTNQRTGYSKAYRFYKANEATKREQKANVSAEYVVFDIETTGLYPDRDEIIEIAGLYIKNLEIVSEFHRLICIEESIPPEVSKLTGITNSLLKEQGVPLDKVMHEFKEFIGDAVLVSHNLSFDMRFLREAMESVGISEIMNHGIDTLTLARKTVKGLRSYNLEELMKYFKLPYEKLHRSMEDAWAVAKLYQKLIEIRKSKN